MQRMLRLLNLEVTRPKATLTALVMTLVMFGSGFSCNQAQVENWMDILAKDLPVMIQMALTISQLVTVLGVKEAPEVEAAVKQIGTEATSDLELAQDAYNVYKSAPNETNKQKVQAAFQTVTSKLPELLAAAHIKNEELLQKVTSAVGLLVGTADVVISMISPALAAKPGTKGVERTLPQPDQLKQNWNNQVGVPLVEG